MQPFFLLSFVLASASESLWPFVLALVSHPRHHRNLLSFVPVAEILWFIRIWPCISGWSTSFQWTRYLFWLAHFCNTKLYGPPHSLRLLLLHHRWPSSTPSSCSLAFAPSVLLDSTALIRLKRLAPAKLTVISAVASRFRSRWTEIDSLSQSAASPPYTAPSRALLRMSHPWRPRRLYRSALKLI